jgi:arylsulfatase A-like enzyme
MDDLVVVTADSVRYDFVDEMPFVADNKVARGITSGHYTRPSLSAVLSSRYEAALRARALSPTIADVLDKQGYTCIGLAPSAQTDEFFGFDSGFHQYENYKNPGNRGSRRREILGRITLLRKLYHRIVPPHAKQDDLPDDDEVVDEAIERFNSADSPRFLWIHLMESHRPYGKEDDAIPKSLDRKALFSPDQLSEKERDQILECYRAVLGRVDNKVERLYREIDGDPLFLFTSDHGDEFGEEGHYFHQPQRRRVADKLVEVPVVAKNFNIPKSELSLFDLAPTLVSELGINPPSVWDGISLDRKATDYAITIAPWGEKASIGYRTPEFSLIGADANVSVEIDDTQAVVDNEELPDDIERQLQDLGYVR